MPFCEGAVRVGVKATGMFVNFVYCCSVYYGVKSYLCLQKVQMYSSSSHSWIGLGQTA